MTVARLRLYSEPYGATGNIGENFQRLLGAPSLDPLQTVIREAVQNIADAAVPPAGPEIHIRLRRLTREQRHTLDTRVLRSLPPEPHSSRKLLSAMRKRRTLFVMEICDFGTTGLGGPTRSNRTPIGVKHTDFIDFLRNIGTARDTPQGGGTYGFGKVALYRASKCRTIIVDTLPQGTGASDRRLIGCHVGSSFELPDNGFLQRFTGRHWWGVKNLQDGIVDPATGVAAKTLASDLGFPERSNDRSGTSIMILDFDTTDEELPTIGNRVVEGLLWSFWPRLMRDTPVHQRFACRVEVDGVRVSIPYPEDFPPLDLFTKAMRAVRSESGNDVRDIYCKNPIKALGRLAIEKGLRTPRRRLVEDNRSLFRNPSHHIALMRPIELVVKYLEGTPLPDEQLEWAGVFVASRDDEVERAFAKSEPPAHDDWNPGNFQPRSREKKFVNVALRELSRIATDMGAEAKKHVGGAPDAGPPLAQVAGRLGAVLEGVGGSGARKKGATRTRRRARPTRARASRPTFERLELRGAEVVAVFSTEVGQDAGRTGSALAARAFVAIEGSKAPRVGDGVRRPVVVSVRSVNGDLTSSTDSLELAGNEGRFEIDVLVPDDCAVTVQAHVLSQA